MKKMENKLSSKIFAVILTIALIFSIVPMEIIANAVGTENDLTITVVNTSGEPISGAKILRGSIIINGTTHSVAESTTDAEGKAIIALGLEGEIQSLSGNITVEYNNSKVSQKVTEEALADNDIRFTFSPAQITGVQIIPREGLIYNGKKQGLIQTEGTASYTITYQLTNSDGKVLINRTSVASNISATEAGTYTVTATVSKAGYETLTIPVNVTIEKAPLIGISIIPKQNLKFSGNAQELVSVVGLQNGVDVVEYTVNGTAEEGTNIPARTEVGTYEVGITVHRDDNHADFKNTVTVEIGKGELDVSGLEINTNELTYNGEAQIPIVVTKNEKAYSLRYKLNDGEYQDTIPTVTEAGEYTVTVLASYENYAAEELEYKVVVKEKQQSLTFAGDYNNGGVTVMAFDDITETLSFRATGGDGTENAIEYSTDNAEIAEISGTGELTVKSAGIVTVKAFKAGDGNHADAEISHTLHITDKGAISFASSEVSYIYGGNEGVVSENTAVIENANDTGKAAYSLVNKKLGLAIDSATGIVTVEDYKVLGDALLEADNNTVYTTVVVNKGEVKEGNTVIFSEASAEYMLSISFLASPGAPYIVSGNMGENGWYKIPSEGETGVMVSAANGYTISKTFIPENANGEDNFTSQVIFNDQGDIERSIYLKNENGEITAPIPVVDSEGNNLKIDTNAPEAASMSAEIIGLSFFEKIADKLGFAQEITVKFTAKDTTSGVDYISWEYTRADDASAINLDEASGEVKAAEETNKNGETVYTAELKLPSDVQDQLYGNISFTATDMAGNTSATVKDNTIFVIDTIDPEISANHTLADVNDLYDNEGNHHYYSGDVDFTFYVTEANFYEEEFKVQVSYNGNKKPAELEWTESGDLHVGSFKLREDGDYIVYMSYKGDFSGNAGNITEYESDIITIDSKEAVIDFSYDREAQSTVFTITESNFKPEDILVSGKVSDINGNTAEVENFLLEADWVKDGDTYSFTTDAYENGIYDLTVTYRNVTGNNTVKVCDRFVIDHDAPVITNIEYAKSPVDEFLSMVTLGFYKSSVTIRFTAVDNTTPVTIFGWMYTREEGASIANLEALEGEVVAVPNGNDNSVYTGTITVPEEVGEQLRGSFAVSATDEYENTSEYLVDTGSIIIVDSVAPNVQIKFSEAVNTVEDTSYYNTENVDVQVTVTEANFYAEDVNITAYRNGIEFIPNVDWAADEEKQDTHIGTFALMGDGDYTVNVTYQDKSENSMKVTDESNPETVIAEYTYESHLITIDTVDPVVTVSYRNSNAVKTMPDADGNTRDYYTAKQTAVVTIKEENFSTAEEYLDLSIAAKNSAGDDLEGDRYTISDWTPISSDTYIITIAYEGDANYTFDISCTDLAKNESADYEPDYFTVDTEKPVNLTAKYSASVRDTFLHNITFGFYNAKMEVTLIAEDETSGVDSFVYSYIKADNVSSVNAGLSNQRIEAENISYSNGLERASASFHIPMLVLGSNNQFNGTVKFEAFDRVGLSEKREESKRIIVDNISPTAQVSINAPVNKENGISYYDGNVNVTISIHEANFYAEDVDVMVTKNGGAAYAVNPSWSSRGTDDHTGTFSLSGDGDYKFIIEYSDKSGNAMPTYTSEAITIDTVIEAPVITINGKEENNKAYKDAVVPAVSFQDENYDSYELTLTRTRYGDKNVNVKDTFVGSSVVIGPNGGSGTFDTFKKIAGNDGIYTLTVKMTDKAGHSAETAVTFTVNRFGSVYEYSDYLAALLENGGVYTGNITDDLVITEYNADRLLSNSLIIEITRDGKPIDDVIYEVSPAMNDQVKVGDSGWFQYVYTISKDNFAMDGVYKVSVSSKDATGNTPENNSHEDMDILFRVDSTIPEITSVVGLEESIINAHEQIVKYTVFDAIGLKSISIYVDGKLYGEAITDFSDDLNNYSGSFVLNESSDVQKVQIVVEDLAGNVTDTDAEGFTSAYTFNDEVTISTNIFVRWFANRVLFWGSIIGVVVLVGALWLIIASKKKKNNG